MYIDESNAEGVSRIGDNLTRKPYSWFAKPVRDSKQPARLYESGRVLKNVVLFSEAIIFLATSYNGDELNVRMRRLIYAFVIRMQ